ncbi:MAG: ACT domain-containing protein [bacterium]
MGDIRVVKIGGSTFRKENLLDIARFIVNNFEPYKTVIVVSAIGRSPYPYSTDELIKLFSDMSSNSNILMDLSKSFVISCGENIATGLLAFAINYINPQFRAIPLNAYQAGIITTDKAIEAEIIDLEIDNLLRLIDNKFTAVVCGFQGVSKGGYITTLKRGGSDITATYIAQKLKSKEVHVIKDVDGLKSAPPNIVPNSLTIRKCHIDELAEATYNGNPVINPDAVNIIQKANIKVFIRSIYSQEYTYSSNEIIPDNIVSNISVKENVTKFFIFLPPQIKTKTHILDISLKSIYENQISLDFINLDILNNIASFVVDANQVDKIKSILKRLYLNFRIVKNLCKVSVIGYNMRGKPGIMYRINKALSREKVFILQAQDSHISVSLLIPNRFVVTTIKALHREFFEQF